MEFAWMLAGFLTAGGAWGYHALQSRLQALKRTYTLELEKLTAEAEAILQRERAQNAESLHKREIALKLRESQLDQIDLAQANTQHALEKERAQLATEKETCAKAFQESQNLQAQYRENLKKLHSLPQEALEDALREEAKTECAQWLQRVRKDYLEKGEEEIQHESRRILTDAMQRIVYTPRDGAGATIVAIPNEEMKGRIIGREGRNIKTFELRTGTTLMIDETPGSILISSFDPMRREIARIALEKLIADGRIHPTAIEDTVCSAEKDIDRTILCHGRHALERLGIDCAAPLIPHLGKLFYRYSYGQNTLDHSIEVALLCGLIAEELGLDAALAKRCGLFHDIGKASETEIDSHAIAGAKLLSRHEEHAIVINAVESHHQESPPGSLYAAIVVIADALSAARPGARSSTLEGYLQRHQKLEAIAHSFEAVEQAYALQAGREIRILVNPSKIDDAAAKILAAKICAKIEQQAHYQGTIRVVVIREQRFTEVAQ